MVQLYIGFGIGVYFVIALLVAIQLDKRLPAPLFFGIIWPITIFFMGLMELIDG